MSGVVRLIDAGVDRVQAWSPKSRVRFAFVVLCVSALCWPTTHILMLLTHPLDLRSWAAHVLLGISWLAIIVTAFDLIATTDIRDEQEKDS